MFSNVGWGEMVILVIAGLVILGPERLPGAIRWTANALRQARDYLSGATSQLRQDFGPEFDDLREPLNELQKLRGMTPRSAITKHLLDGDDSFLTGTFDAPAPPPPDASPPPSSSPPSPSPSPSSSPESSSQSPSSSSQSPSSSSQSPSSPAVRPAGVRPAPVRPAGGPPAPVRPAGGPPIDPDAT